MCPLTLSEEIVSNAVSDTRTEPKTSDDVDEIDGLEEVQIPVQTRLQQITAENKVSYLIAARCTLLSVPVVMCVVLSRRVYKNSSGTCT